MAADVAITTYSVPECFQQAMLSIRNKLSNGGFDIAGQLDVTRRVEQAVGIRLAPCTILFIRPHVCSMDLGVIYRNSFPLRVVIAGCDKHTDIHIGNIDCITPVVHEELTKAIRSMAMRQALV